MNAGDNYLGSRHRAAARLGAANDDTSTQVTQGAGLYPSKDRAKDTPIYDGKTPARGDRPDPAACARGPSLWGPRPNLNRQTRRNRMFGSRGPYRPDAHTGEGPKGTHGCIIPRAARLVLRGSRLTERRQIALARDVPRTQIQALTPARYAKGHAPPRVCSER